jgi:hypothetical protein
VISVHDIVVPVTTTKLKHGSLETEFAQPGTGLVFSGQRQLTRVVVPRTDKVDGLDIGRGSQGELELNGGHYERVANIRCEISSLKKSCRR